MEHKHSRENQNKPRGIWTMISKPFYLIPRWNFIMLETIQEKYELAYDPN